VLGHLDEFPELLGAQLVVHGSSARADELCRRLGLPVTRLVSASGLEFRYTPRPVLEAYVMATLAVNKELVAYLASRGIRALGLAGPDGAVIRARRKALLIAEVEGVEMAIRDDFSGELVAVDAELLGRLMRAYVPVIAPIALGEEHELLNVDGDKLALFLAKALKAQELTFLSRSALLLGGRVAERLSLGALEEALREAKGGMRRKLLACREALASGIARVRIRGLNGETEVVP